MRLRGTRRKLQYIPVSKLKQHDTIQRPVNERHVKKLKANFNADAFDPVSVIKNGTDTYFVFNGGHRIEVVRELYGNKIEIPTFVYEGLTEAEEARLSEQSNNTRLAWSPIQRFGLALLAKNEEALDIESVLFSHGLRVKQASTNDAVPAITAVKWIYRKYGRDTLYNVLSVVIEAWGRDHDGYNGHILKGIATVLGNNPELSFKPFAKKIGKSAPSLVTLNRGRDMASVIKVSVPTGISMVLVRSYNRGRKNGRLSEIA